MRGLAIFRYQIVGGCYWADFGCSSLKAVASTTLGEVGGNMFRSDLKNILGVL